MTSSLDMIRGRSNIITLTNNSGGALIAGDVCIQDTSADERVTTTTSAANTAKIFVAAESIAIGAAGKFYESGYCPFVNVSASVTRGRYLFTHTVAKQAAESATYGAGAFGRILKSGTSPSAIIYNATAQIGGSGSDTTAIHTNAGDEILGITEKTVLAADDLFVIEDSEAYGVKKRVKQSNLGGGGNVTTTSAYASPPATPAAGDVWFPSDGHSVLRYTGAAWAHWGPIFPLTPLAVADFAWINQGTATATDTAGGIYLYAPAATNNMRILKKAAPATPYTITVCALMGGMSLTNSNHWGLCFRQSSDGKLATFGGNSNTTFQVMSQKFNSATSFNATYSNVNFTHSCQWFRIADTGVNRVCSTSPDGQNWEVFHTIGRTDFLTADEVGIFVHANSAVQLGITFISWKAA